MKLTKKLMFLVLTAIIAATFFPAVAFANGEKLSVGVPSLPVSQGTEFDVNVSIEGNTGIAGFTLELKYDNAVFEYVSVTRGSVLTEAGLNPTSNDAAGNGYHRVRTGVFSAADFNANGVLYTVRFKAKNAAPNGEYDFELWYDDYDIINQALQEVRPSITNGKVSVGQPPMEQVSAPTANPTGGAIQSGATVSLTSATSGASIRYTADGSEPSSTNGMLYTAPVVISQTVTIKAIAYKSGMADSGVSVFTYTVSPTSTDAAFVVSTAESMPGKEVDVTISMKNNPGIVTAFLDIHYDATKLELISISDGKLLTNPTFGNDLSANPFSANWDGGLLQSNITADGVLATLKFKIKDNAPEGLAEVRVSYAPDDVFDYDMDNVAFNCEDGGINIVQRLPGDVNEDGSINAKDIATLNRYLAGWNGISINFANADVNQDDNVNAKDLAVLNRYLAGWAGVVLQ